MIRVLISLFICLAVLFVRPCFVIAGNTVNYIVNYRVGSLTDISIDKDPQPLVIDTAVAGEDPTPVSDSSTSYSFSTNDAAKKITAKLNRKLPQYTTLTIKLAAPPGGISLGEVPLSTRSVDLVTGIGQKKGKNLNITYTFYDDVRSGVVPTTVLKVTFTITDG
ncbi:MAG: hypothetical protein AB9903_31550 [Vulcanimicrobiota bacterium]